MEKKFVEGQKGDDIIPFDGTSATTNVASFRRGSSAKIF
jgi:hypothetical protein